jgi:hypothetical protein
MSRRPSAADDDGLVTCLICGKRYKSLGPHLFRIHQTSAADYRAAHQLPASATLMATSTRKALSAARQEAMKDDPELVARMRAATPPVKDIARRSAAARARTDGLEAVKASRRRGWDQAIAKSVAARREHLDQAARAAGFSSWRQALEDLQDRSSREVAERLGVGKTTVRRWRRKQAAPPT